MNLLQAIVARHSVRAYTDRPIEADIVAALNEEIALGNEAGGLHMQLITEEPTAFKSFLAKYGHFRNVRNYVAVVGTDADDLFERIGYYGERVVLRAQQLGLNTCWVALTFSRRKAKYVVDKGERLICVIAVGYGQTAGTPHKSRPIHEVSRVNTKTVPDWFRKGMAAALLAPTAVNQQKFLLTLQPDGKVKAQATGGAYGTLDLGIVKYHFELGAGQPVQWC